eukprot:TRINITY_DN8618_c0_g1_i1.p1 TRINITY_DN8618_c0_g1~~TRINITY_DN8618_c0_g1_i1.p1  ORF type:complete len:1007 (+),score=193.25 TRINITY_DN8618_c0_g1_i1:113-3133(+)
MGMQTSVVSCVSDDCRDHCNRANIVAEQDATDAAMYICKGGDLMSPRSKAGLKRHHSFVPAVEDGDSDSSVDEQHMDAAVMRTMLTLQVTQAPGINVGSVHDAAKEFAEEEERRNEQMDMEVDNTLGATATLPLGEDKELAEPEAEDATETVGDSNSEEANELFTVSRRTMRRRERQSVWLIDTMERAVSSRLQLVIENHREITQFYDFEGSLGEGSYGSVSKACVRGTGALRAVKAIAKAHMVASMNRLKAELEITKMVDHPNVIKLYEIFEDKTNIYLVMELCWGGELLDRIVQQDHLTESQTTHVMTQTLRAVYYLHSNLIMHRDLKPQNILIVTKEPIERANMKISDFGMGTQFSKGQIFTAQVGTLAFMAPEVLTGSGYTEMCDNWSCGVIMFLCLGGYLPFLGSNKEAMKSKVLNKRVAFVGEQWTNVSEEAVSVIHALLRKSPVERYTAKQALRSPWLQNMQRKAPLKLQQDLVERLCSFRGLNRFKKAALQLTVSLLNEKQVGELCEAFMRLDKDGDGLLDISELADRLDNKEQLKQIFLSDNNDGSLVDYSYTEFLAATFDRDRHIQKDVCKAAYSVFDQDGDGEITISELVNGRLLGNLSEDEIKHLIKDLDQNGDGKVDFEEFSDMMRGRREEIAWEAAARKRAAERSASPHGTSPAGSRASSPPMSARDTGSPKNARATCLHAAVSLAAERPADVAPPQARRRSADAPQPQVNLADSRSSSMTAASTTSKPGSAARSATTSPSRAKTKSETGDTQTAKTQLSAASSAAASQGTKRQAEGSSSTSSKVALPAKPAALKSLPPALKRSTSSLKPEAPQAPSGQSRSVPSRRAKIADQSPEPSDSRERRKLERSPSQTARYEAALSRKRAEEKTARPASEASSSPTPKARPAKPASEASSSPTPKARPAQAESQSSSSPTPKPRPAQAASQSPSSPTPKARRAQPASESSSSPTPKARPRVAFGEGADSGTSQTRPASAEARKGTCAQNGQQMRRKT